MTKLLIDQAVIDQALEALDLAKRSHGKMLLSDPPQEAWKTYRVDDAIRESTTALRQTKEQPTPPPECKTEAEKTAFGFGWWKALESQRGQAQQAEPVAWEQFYPDMGNPNLNHALTSPPTQQPVATNDTSKDRVDETAKQRHEPVATVYEGVIAKWNLPATFTGFLYTSPPTRQPLTNEQIDQITEQLDDTTIGWSTHEFARAIEAAHGIKGEA